MDISQIERQLKYVTNSAGDKTEVIVPVALWNAVLGLLPKLESGLDPSDEFESKQDILSDLKDALRETQQGISYPVADLWDGIDS